MASPAIPATIPVDGFDLPLRLTMEEADAILAAPSGREAFVG